MCARVGVVDVCCVCESDYLRQAQFEIPFSMRPKYICDHPFFFPCFFTLPVCTHITTTHNTPTSDACIPKQWRFRACVCVCMYIHPLVYIHTYIQIMCGCICASMFAYGMQALL